ncbi:HdeD family acid-resistance protein [Thermophagus sp. OGC60D27]|uniref:HdeD family acid-resistance protein n=1 Tax=Thermophagus sp. OGC60D27 TaxID=3458415 RepID=UPI004037E220
MNRLYVQTPTSEIIKGVAALLISLLIFIDPAGALMTIATYFGLLALIGGVITIIAALRSHRQGRNFILIQGIFFTLIGLLIVIYPGGTASLMVVLIGLFITFLGAIQLAGYLQMKDVLPAPQLSLIHAILSLAIGLLLLFNPFEGAVLATLIMGAYALWYGISRLYLAWQIHHH